MERHVVAAAVRVLGSVSQHQSPAAQDLEILQKFAPEMAMYPPEDLACEIILSEVAQETKPQETKPKVMTAGGGD